MEGQVGVPSVELLAVSISAPVPCLAREWIGGLPYGGDPML